MIGRSPALAGVRKLIAQVAPTESTVLILGETGTGKELIARAIHRLSPRRNRPLIKVNCGAISPPWIESGFLGDEKCLVLGFIGSTWLRSYFAARRPGRSASRYASASTPR